MVRRLHNWWQDENGWWWWQDVDTGKWYIPWDKGTFEDRCIAVDSLCSPPTVPQKALLTECFDNPQRPNEANAHLLFKQRFKDRDGKFARSLVISAAKIKAWFSSEKQRRQKAAAVHAVATEALDEGGAAADGQRGGGGRQARLPHEGRNLRQWLRRW